MRCLACGRLAPGGAELTPHPTAWGPVTGRTGCPCRAVTRVMLWTSFGICVPLLISNFTTGLSLYSR